MKAEEMVGRTFGKLFVEAVSQRKPTKSNPVRYLDCVCKCGKRVERRKDNVLNGKVTSCGCYREQVNKEQAPRRVALMNVARLERYAHMHMINDEVSRVLAGDDDL